MKKILSAFQLTTIRKKTLLLSKLMGGSIVLFYLLTSELPADSSLSFLIWFCLMAAVIICVDILLGRLISTPLNEINREAERMAHLDFTARCRINSNDEFGRLSQSLNTMSANLQDALQKLEQANIQLEKDVQKERLLQAQRKELTDNLSHQMKTPLGLIRAYTEGLKDEVDETKKQQYLDAILSAEDRISHMLVSLLDLSALESGSAELSDETFDFIEMAETCAGRLLLGTPGGNYRFTYRLPDTPVLIRADSKRMEQVLDNLIENARKNVREGGEIRLTISCFEKEVSFSLFNQCAPIPEPEFPKIWSKFYRGQNTAGSGSGLGLAIVAQVLSAYRVPYGVRNHKNGVEFYFSFPIIT
ncbi:MAG: HAMP domain-containing sensor histidine kinase [Blautia sp.]|jgi:two-component system sensor histidine kinase VanS|uniref:HAMP domain-containing sensor histidine kinase n=1 Tax=Blautia sp. TaxID=1955243 RepID=UPI003D8DD872